MSMVPPHSLHTHAHLPMDRPKPPTSLLSHPPKQAEDEAFPKHAPQPDSNKPRRDGQLRNEGKLQSEGKPRSEGKGNTEPPRAYEAVVIGLIYRKPQTSWGVVRVRLAEEIACAKGAVMPVSLGSWIRLEGWWEDCEQWGRLLRVWSMREFVPVDPEGMTRYLLSLRLHRLTPPRCEELVRHFGRHALDRKSVV